MAGLGSNIWPFSAMKEQTVDGQAMVFCPKIYICNEVPGNGTYSGKPCYEISDYKETGFHCAPTFMTNGEENPTGIQWGSYIASKDSNGKAASIAGATPWVNIAYTAIDAAARTRNTGTGEQAGWRPHNIYDHHLWARLMLLEKGTADLQNAIGGSSAANGVTWHGIHDVWGGASYYFWIYGLTTTGTSSTFTILDKNGNNSMIDTSIAPPGSGWPVNLHTEKGTNYDFGDVFLASSVSSTETAGSLGGYQDLVGGGAFSASSGAGAALGPFCLGNYSTSNSYGYLSFRLARGA